MQVTTAATLAKSLATTISRGATLLTTDGYTVAATAQPAVYTVTKPTNRPVKVGEKSAYTVDVAGATCDCAAYAQHGTCKHLIAVTAEVAKALALVGPMLPAPVAVNIEARKEVKPVSRAGKYGSDEWKRNVARDFC